MHRLSVRQLLLVALLLLTAMPALADGPFRFYPITPCRLVDTRSTEAPALAAGSTRDFQVQGKCGVPVGAKAAALNATVFVPSSNGHLRLFPSGSPLPNISTINFQSGIVIANGAVVSLSANANDLSVYTFLGTGGSTHFILDVTGYFAPAAP
ncbi:MAG: hypothetical protein ABUT39_14140 [Acidobacteriota bacterium]